MCRREAGEKQNHAGDDGKRKERKRGLGLPPSHRPPRSFLFSIIAILTVVIPSRSLCGGESDNLTYSATISPIFSHLSLTSLPTQTFLGLPHAFLPHERSFVLTKPYKNVCVEGQPFNFLQIVFRHFSLFCFLTAEYNCLDHVTA